MNTCVLSSLLPFFFLGIVLIPSFDGTNVENHDAIFSNPSYNNVMPVANVGGAEYRGQVMARLEYLEAALRGRDVSGWPAELQAERARNIERLRAYRLEGKFPINYEHPGEQHPCFLDRDGNLCAVANLIAKSDGMDLVRTINRRYQYATVSQMEMPEIDAWIARSGLTREEVITIQEPGSFVEPNYSSGLIASPLPVLRDTIVQILPLDSTAIEQRVAKNKESNLSQSK